MPSRAAARLLAREDIRNRIKQLQEERQSCSRVESGLRKLAFGSSADALKLLLGGEDDRVKGALDVRSGAPRISSGSTFLTSRISRDRRAAGWRLNSMTA